MGAISKHFDRTDAAKLAINAGADIIRFVPALIITRENIDDMIKILDESIGACL